MADRHQERHEERTDEQERRRAEPASRDAGVGQGPGARVRGALVSKARKAAHARGGMAKKHGAKVAVGAAASLSVLGAANAVQPAGDAALEHGLAEPAREAARFSALETFVGAPFDLPIEENDRIDFFIEFLTGQKHDDARLWLERLGHFGPMIIAELDARDMPRDLIYLAMIESGFEPDAYSKASAVGIWQFIAETGQRYGLEVSPYVDERRDPVKATDAALTYLQEMHDRFGSWYLAAAGYNTGENRVARLLRETTGSERASDADYWRISPRLPRETRDYVPVMLAAAHLGKDPERFGFHNLQYQEPLAYEVVHIPAGTPLAEVAAAGGLDAGAVEALNPHLVRKQTPPDRGWDVRVPIGVGTQIAASFGTGAGAGLPAQG
jgi:hypothetical protein